jgi:hypothetical protein
MVRSLFELRIARERLDQSGCQKIIFDYTDQAPIEVLTEYGFPHQFVGRGIGLQSIPDMLDRGHELRGRWSYYAQDPDGLRLAFQHPEDAVLMRMLLDV